MLKEVQCIQLDGQQKLNRKNPFVLAFCEIYVPRKLPRIWYEFDINIVYQPGTQNQVVDAFPGIL